MLRLKVETDPRWVEVAMSDLGAFLIDHAYCERKASGTALKLLTGYPERKSLANAMLDLAREELEHFVLVYRQIEARGLLLTPDGPDLYVNLLAKQVRGHHTDHLLDRLLLAAIIEGRSCERFILLEAALPMGELKELYKDLIRAEARHHGLFIHLAKEYFDHELVEARLEDMLTAEAEIIKKVPLRAAVH
jgi:tRNA 2-(methylsulfanyl)-N6-isopentenyladenosine37 hydroxylase